MRLKLKRLKFSHALFEARLTGDIKTTSKTCKSLTHEHV